MTKLLITNRSRPSGDQFDQAAVDRIERNIDGTFDFLRTILDNPALLDRIPDGADIVLSHDDDPALSAANQHAGLNGQRVGRPVSVHRVRSARPVRLGVWSAAHRRGRTSAGRLILNLPRSARRLLADASAPRKP